MVDKEEMLSHIREKIADKKLTFGCKISLGKEFVIISAEIDERSENKAFTYRATSLDGKRQRVLSLGELITPSCLIYGHPIMIGCVLHWISENRDITYGDIEDIALMVRDKREDTRKPLSEQSIETIRFIYELVKENE